MDITGRTDIVADRQHRESALLARRVDEFPKVIKTVNPEQGEPFALSVGQMVGIEDSGQDSYGHQLISAEGGDPGAGLAGATGSKFVFRAEMPRIRRFTPCNG